MPADMLEEEDTRGISDLLFTLPDSTVAQWLNTH
jgi:hypothetical protein